MGQKTAAKWLNEFGDLSTIKSNAEGIKGAVGENLRNSLNDLDRNVELVSLKYDVELDVSFDSLLELNTNQERLDDLFNELEFKTPRKAVTKTETKNENLSQQEPTLDKKIINSSYETLFNGDDL